MEYLRSKGVYVPQYNNSHKKKYLLVESKENIRLLEEYRNDIRNNNAK